MRWCSKRFRVLVRDGWRCVICDSPYNLTIDHWMPSSVVVNKKPENLITMCRACNRFKADSVPGTYLKRLSRIGVVKEVIWDKVLKAKLKPLPDEQVSAPRYFRILSAYHFLGHK